MKTLIVSILVVISCFIFSACPQSQVAWPLMDYHGVWKIESIINYQKDAVTGDFKIISENYNAGEMFFYNNVSDQFNNFSIMLDSMNILSLYAFGVFYDAGSEIPDHMIERCWYLETKKQDKITVWGVVSTVEYQQVLYCDKKGRNEYILVYLWKNGAIEGQEEYKIKRIKA